MSSVTADASDVSERAPGITLRDHVVPFEQRVVDRLSRVDIIDVAHGTPTALVHVPGFIEHDMLAQAQAELLRLNLDRYDPALVQPEIQRLIPAAFDWYREDGKLDPGYFDEAKRSQMLIGQAAPIISAIQRYIPIVLSEAWGAPVEPATCHGRPLANGMLRAINQGAGLHFDDIAFELPDGLDRMPLVQLSVLIALTTPEGGEVEVFEHPHNPRDERHRNHTSYGYLDSAVEGDRSVKAKPSPGDLYIFRTDRLHKVHPNLGCGDRTTISSFLGITAPPSSGLIIWS